MSYKRETFGLLFLATHAGGNFTNSDGYCSAIITKIKCVKILCQYYVSDGLNLHRWLISVGIGLGTIDEILRHSNI